MLIHKPRKVVILKPRHPEKILTLIPTAKSFVHKGVTLVAVPHRVEETRVLRNIGIKVPSPILYYYDWPRSAEIKEPFEAQYKTAAFLTYYNRAYCLNGMGSGKTLSDLWAYDYLRKEGFVRSMLVISTLSTLERTWADTVFANFPHLNFVVLHGTKAKRENLLNVPADVYIINHDGVEVIAEQLAAKEEIDIVSVDEIAEAARNATTDRWKFLNWVINGKAATKLQTEPVVDKLGVQCRDVVGRPMVRSKRVPLGKDGKFRMAWGLTGTPTPQKPTDAWAQCRLVTPETVPSYFNAFKAQTMRQTAPFTWVPKEGAQTRVFEVMQPAIRFSREECVDLPPTTYSTRDAPLTVEQHKAYTAMLRKLKAEVEGGIITAVNEAVKVNKLVQICCGVAYDQNGGEVSVPCHSRLKVLREIVEEAETKTIVFVPFVSSVRMVAEYLRKEGFSVGVVYGDVSKGERDTIFSEFQRYKDPQVIVAQPAAMSHGLTLTSANTIVWYAPTNRTDTYLQANERIVRPGQKFNTLIVHISGSAVENKMYERLRHNQRMQNILLDMVQEAREEECL